ncbi:Protein lifeguard 1 [Liparis tanakae]|uniref:Protein lifeguard 1 n=1 Tax=Liparis tanakae TaxID=230148 RepID=A0A4Z2EZI8_9TELE|nr:Protein lifeguard 1 [Liparis tanakae]
MVHYLYILYAGLGTLLFSWLILGGGDRRYQVSPEEYVFAALVLYLDIVTLFLQLLQYISLCSSASRHSSDAAARRRPAAWRRRADLTGGHFETEDLTGGHFETEDLTGGHFETEDSPSAAACARPPPPERLSSDVLLVAAQPPSLPGDSLPLNASLLLTPSGSSYTSVIDLERKPRGAGTQDAVAGVVGVGRVATETRHVSSPPLPASPPELELGVLLKPRHGLFVSACPPRGGADVFVVLCVNVDQRATLPG